MHGRPTHIDLERERGLTLTWADGTTSFYTIEHLRRMSPSADARHLREEMASNPLAVLPASVANSGPLAAVGAELVGNYAIRVRFSDGHDTGIYSWRYLREIEVPGPPPPTRAGHEPAFSVRGQNPPAAGGVGNAAERNLPPV